VAFRRTRLFHRPPHPSSRRCRIRSRLGCETRAHPRRTRQSPCRSARQMRHSLGAARHPLFRLRESRVAAPRRFQTTRMRTDVREETKMSLRTALYLNSISILLLFIVSNVSLALTTPHYCIVAFQVPFSDHSFQLPYWAWSLSLLLIPLCILTMLISWLLVLVRVLKRVRADELRRLSTGDGSTHRRT
jgi:hypothetical protein